MEFGFGLAFNRCRSTTTLVTICHGLVITGLGGNIHVMSIPQNEMRTSAVKVIGTNEIFNIYHIPHLDSCANTEMGAVGTRYYGTGTIHLHIFILFFIMFTLFRDMVVTCPSLTMD
jgi:hypothetical protein